MAINEKKEYETMLKLLATSNTMVNLANKFSDLAVDAEDPEIKKLADAISRHLRPSPYTAVKSDMRKFSCYQLYGMLGGANEHGQTLAQLIEISKKHCDAALASHEPGWMIKARAAGWGPIVKKAA
jgi:hypothetical protein